MGPPFTDTDHTLWKFFSSLGWRGVRGIQIGVFISGSSSWVWYFICRGCQALACGFVLHSRCGGGAPFWPLLLGVWAGGPWEWLWEYRRRLACEWKRMVFWLISLPREALYLWNVFFHLGETPNFAKFHQSFINSFRFLGNCFSCKIMLKKNLLQVFTLSLDKVNLFSSL